MEDILSQVVIGRYGLQLKKGSEYVKAGKED